jgi:hypothetical protein
MMAPRSIVVLALLLRVHYAHGDDAAVTDASPRVDGSPSGLVHPSDAAPASIDLPADVVGPTLSVAASQAEVSLGRPFVVIVTAVFRPDVTVNLVDPVQLGAGFEVQRRWSNDSVRADGKTQRQWQLEVLPWELGEQMLPPIVVTYVAGGRAHQVSTMPLTLRVVGTLGDSDISDDDKLRPLLPPKELNTRTWVWLWIAGVGLATMVLTSLALLWNRRRHQRIERITGGAVAWKNLDDAGKRALRALAQVEQSGVIDAAPLQSFERMAAIMRTFGSQRYQVGGSDLTTSEWLEHLQQRAPHANRELFARWFAPVDMVKYASAQAQSSDAAAALQQARALVAMSLQGSNGIQGNVENTSARVSGDSLSEASHE